jgi:hypothetical protein
MAAGLCLALAVGGGLLASLPVDRFTLEWTHSVEKIEWREQWRIAAGRLELTEAQIEGSGAGMDPPADARRVGNGWVYTPVVAPLERLVLANSVFTADYTLCAEGRCRRLADWTGLSDRPIALSACTTD